MSTTEPQGPCFEFYLTSDQALVPRHTTLKNGDVRVYFRSPEYFKVEGNGAAVVNTGVRLKVPTRSKALMAFRRPDWMPKHIEVRAHTNGPGGAVVVTLGNASEFPFIVSDGATLLVGYIQRTELTWWEKLLGWIVR